MHKKAVFIASFFCLLTATWPTHALAQVAPTARVGGLPINFGVGISDYNLDYGSGRRMQGVVARGGMDIFHGFGLDGSARAIFINTPSQLTRMQQNTFLGGVYYERRAWFGVRPFVRFGAGLGTIEFPSRNPHYTRDSYTVLAPSGGIEIPVIRSVFVRAEYEYQFWKQFQSPNDLTPQGATLGVTYYLSNFHLRPHPEH